jgi:3-methyl-2-oxobutanoate hydroxymethyltransferase
MTAPLNLTPKSVNGAKNLRMEPNDMGGMTIKDLREAKGNRTIAYVQVASEEEAVAASAAGMDMIGTAFVPDRAHFARAVPDTHFQFGLPWGKHVDSTEALRLARTIQGET